jgi:hypothetical protein
MNLQDTVRRLAGVVSLAVLLAAAAAAQGYDTPLTIQGLDHNTLVSAASRAAGGITIGIRDNPSLMFANPAALGGLKGLRFSIGAQQQFTKATQRQEYSPLKYYSNFSLLMEGRTSEIPDPDSLPPNPTAGDSVQRPYDTIMPNWERSKDRMLPLQAMVAMPFEAGGIEFVAGAGAVQYADLNQYYRNSNVLSPSILTERPLPIPRPPSDSLPVITQWSQYTRLREGYLRGYGMAFAGTIPNSGVTLGFSGMLIDGSTDDTEDRLARGRLTFYTQFFRLDSVYGHTTLTGTSDYSGQEFTVSGIFRGRFVSAGVAVKLPTRITRSYAGVLSTDTTGTPANRTVATTDRVTLPWRGSAGIALTLSPQVTFGLEYELRSYASAVYSFGRSSGGVESNPWISASIIHAGIVYMPASWLAVRGGLRSQTEVFEPEGNPIAGEAVSASVYSGGLGFLWEGVHLDLTYEYMSMKYQDVWGSAVSFNTDRRHTIVAEIAYDIPLQ